MTITLDNIIPAFLEKEKIDSSGIWNNRVVFNQGEQIHIVASSGRGKTSFMHFLYGLRNEYTGNILLDTKKIQTMNAVELAETRRSVNSIIFQNLRLFTANTVFDNIISRYNIEKIKTIGDSYMCASGLPAANDAHAEMVVKAALEFQNYIEQNKRNNEASGRRYFELRIGVHSGPVVAGIVGNKKFAYDIWGDTVNIASRMESCGEIGKVNVSGATYELVKHLFKCTYRGKIEAKHKGEIDMYFVEPI